MNIAYFVQQSRTKLEIRNPKLETNSNDRNSNFQNTQLD